MDNEKLISKIFFEIQKDPSDYRAYEDVFSLCRSIEESDFKLAHDTNAELRSYISRGMKTSAYAKLFDLYRRSLLFDAPYKFDSYLLYIEINRKPEERFYQPRRRILKQVVDNLQKLVDDELDELFISMPPRVGKTTILMFFVTWLIGRNSESSNLYSALQYVEAFAKNGYVGTVAGVNIYTKKDATSGSIYMGTKEAVTLFNKKGVEIEQERDANTRENRIFSRKYYLAALTNETKVVKLFKGTATAATETTVTAGITYYKKVGNGYVAVTPATDDNPNTSGWYTIA